MVEVRELCDSMVSDPIYLANLVKRLKSGKLHPSVEQMLWYFAKGKPKESIEFTGLIGTGDLSRTSPAELLSELEAAQRMIQEYIGPPSPGLGLRSLAPGQVRDASREADS